MGVSARVRKWRVIIPPERRGRNSGFFRRKEREEREGLGKDEQ
jgi:hypothetical protein